MAKLASENEHLYGKNEQLLCQLTTHSELPTTNQQLMATLAEVKERMEGLGVENEQLKHEFTVCSDSEALKKELQQGQNRINKLWKKNCEQVKEFDLIIWEKDKELESLKKELKAKSVIGNLPTQPVTEQLNRVCDTKVEEATFGMQKNTSLPLNKTLPVTTLGDPVATNPHNDQIRTSSQLLTKLTGQSLSQSYRDPRDCVPQSKTFTSSEAHSRECVPCSETVTSSGVHYVPIRGTVTCSEAPQTLSCPVQHARLYNPPQIMYPFQYPGQIDPVNTSVPRMPLLVTPTETSVQCRGKVSPIDSFTGENREIGFDNWLLTLERAAAWNNWTGDEMIIQLAGYLCGRALQEWNLIAAADRTTYQSAVVALRSRLDPGNKTLAALDFRHIVQKETENVSDFIRRLERTFQIAFGRDPMSTETKNLLLYGRLQDGLRIDLVSKAPAISGAQNYKELCMAARNEEKCLAELKRTRQCSRGEWTVSA